MKTVIIGGGAAGMMCAALLSDKSEKIIIEKNAKPGRKIYITGKGRCNLTNLCDKNEFIDNVVGGGRFMYSSFGRFSNYDVMDFFESHGLPLKVERGNRVFPESDKSADVIDTLRRACRENGAAFMYESEVKDIILNEDRDAVCGIRLSDGTEMEFDNVVVATGGLSYPSTGSTGDGYRFARTAGLSVTKCYPSLVSFKIKEEFCAEMSGLSLKNVSISVIKDDKEIYSDFGEMLFTHTGVSGPMILSASATCSINAAGARLVIDLKPALDEEKLDVRLIRDFEADRNKELKNVLRGLLPASMVPVFIGKLASAMAGAGMKAKGGMSLSETIAETKANSVTAEERREIVHLLKNFDMNITGLGGFNEAVVTKGGVDLKEINPKTMEAKNIKGLYFIGEVLDVDAFTGGFNLQIAWSTAAAAAADISAGCEEE
ncbi:MAG: NAD(P)/FAD-dependent oxidoreductase [Lachnospiraceae bacterium]|nr:NAD(P)/FAD-dependent oxidoreductase [Lachnospiraceae bacterium]